LISISHYADLDEKSRWDIFFERYFFWFGKSDRLVAISPRTADFLSKEVDAKKVKLIPNGVPVDSFRQGDPSEGLLYLGKIEPRKRQVETQCLALDYGIDFVGHIADERYGDISSEGQLKFIGAWTRAEVFENMHKYSALCLFSITEGDALVLYEAQAAGLGIFVTEGALGSQSPDIPWVVQVDFSKISIDTAVKNNLSQMVSSRDKIRSFARAHFDEKVCFGAWLDLIREIETESPKRN
jgi:glycosyltransferase involved in cell wall biosynthesis